MIIELDNNVFVRKINPMGNTEEGIVNPFSRIRNYLSLAGISPKEYSLGEATANDCFIVCQEGEFWVVSYAERGSRFWPAIFCDIKDAMDYMVLKLTPRD